jgi:hypothetical protein
MIRKRFGASHGSGFLLGSSDTGCGRGLAYASSKRVVRLMHADFA